MLVLAGIGLGGSDSYKEDDEGVEAHGPHGDSDYKSSS